MRKEAGNILLWLVLGIVAVGLGAVIVWRYFAATDSLNNAQNSEQTSNVAQQTPATYKNVTIEAWGVSFGIPVSLKDKEVTVKYQDSANEKPELVYYYSTELDKAKNTCGDKAQNPEYRQPFIIVSKHSENTEGERNLAGVQTGDVAAVDGAYYYVSTPNIADCYDAATVKPFISDQVRKAVVDSIKATKQ